MAATCDAYLQGIRVRATRLDECGAPVAGSCSTVVSKGFINVEIENNETSGEEINPVLADGTRCYYVQTPKNLNNVQVSIEFCTVDPELFEMMTGAPLVLDDSSPTPYALGFTTDSAAYGIANVALEVWTNLAPTACVVGTTSRRWGYYLLPWLTQGVVGKPTIENGAVNFSVSEAITRDGNAWGVGPYDIQYDNAGLPAPLFAPITTTTHDLLYKVNMAPPVPVCGCTELVIAS